MTRVTRSRQTASSVSEIKVKTTVKRTIKGAITKKTIGKTRSNLRSSQDENAMPITKINQVSKANDSKKKGLVLASKLLSDKDDSLHSTVLAMKSPVLRDRTNTTNELGKVNAVSKISGDMVLDKNKKTTDKRTTRKAKKQGVSKTNTLTSSIEKYTVKLPRAQTQDYDKNRLPQTEDLPFKKAIEKVLEKTDINENIDKSLEPLISGKSKSKTTPINKKALKRKNISMEDVEKLLNEDDNESMESHETMVDDEIESVQKMASTHKKALKKKNISMEDVEKLLNEDDNENVEGHETSDNDETESVHEENAKMENHKSKKFFKCKGIEEKLKPVVLIKNNSSKPKKGRAAKKVKNNDSTFSPKVEGPGQYTKSENKNLRTRMAKDYCETSMISNSKDEENKDAKKPVNCNKKGIPIYKAIQLSQEEKKKEPDEIYEFDSSQDDGQKSKKRKKTVKRPAIKRAKKNTNLLLGLAPLPKKKSIKTVRKNVQFKVKDIDKVNTNTVLNKKKVNGTLATKKNTVISDTQTDGVIPDDFPEMGGSTFGEAPTIKIISNEKLEGSSKYHLTSTPAPKTSASGLKVFAPKNNVSSQPYQQLKIMANHSLIRQSMSPIKKINDEFDAGSPWRAVDTFTRVNKLVQSTPQVNRHATQHVKKPVEHIAQLNKKSFGSEETIHLSAAANIKSPIKDRSLEEMSTMKQDEQRKFGTVISNLSPSKSISTTGSSNNSSVQRSPLQGTSLQSATPVNNQQSPAKAISSPSADPNLPVNYKTLDTKDPSISFDNKENISPKTSPKKKIVAPSPFRFERIRSSKRLAAISSTSKTLEKASPTKVLESDPEAGPSSLDKPKPMAMKQTNLNNFLNLDEMPECANISTPHGIFNDVCSTPISGKKPRKLVDEANIENAFGFDDFESDDAPSIESVSNVKIATEADVKNSVKGKLFPKARVKSAVPSRISENTVKKTLLKNVLKKKIVEKAPEMLKQQEDSDSSTQENEDFHDQMMQYKESEKDKKKIMLDAISFSDTFDVLSENGEELQAYVPEEIPLFVDLEPVHFAQPPRKSYNKRKRNICFDVDRYESSDEEDMPEKKKGKKKKSKEPQLKKEEKKRMEDWVKNVNKTFDEIEHFDLVVE